MPEQHVGHKQQIREIIYLLVRNIRISCPASISASNALLYILYLYISDR